MITTTLIHIAIWTHFAVAHAANTHFDVRAEFKGAASPHSSFQDLGLPSNPSESSEENVVVRKTAFSERPGVSQDTVSHRDEGIAAEPVEVTTAPHTGYCAVPLSVHLVRPVYDGAKLCLDQEPNDGCDKEIAVLQAEASRFTSSIDLRECKRSKLGHAQFP